MYPTLASFNKMRILLFLLCLAFVYGENECLTEVPHCGLCNEDKPTECVACKNNKFLTIINDEQSCEDDCLNNDQDDEYHYQYTDESGVELGKCLPSCGYGKFAEGDTDKWCYDCGEGCKTCDKDKCLSCFKDEHLIELDECVESCTKGFFENPNVTPKECKKCDGNCVTCQGSATNCLTCENPTPWLQGGVCAGSCLDTKYKHDTNEGKKCLDECPGGYYEDDYEMTCEKCGEDCKACTDGDSCTECIEESGKEYLEDGQCIDKCSEGMWIYVAEKKCFESEDDCPPGTHGEQEEDKNYCVETPAPPSFGGYLFSGVAIVLALVTLI